MKREHWLTLLLTIAILLRLALLLHERHARQAREAAAPGAVTPAAPARRP